jgi:hypothetical protein
MDAWWPLPADTQERWPLLAMMLIGAGILRWRSIGRGVSGPYGAEFPRNPDPAPARDMA